MSRLTTLIATLLTVALSYANPLKVACVGNSITYGFLISDREQNCYPAQLAQMLGSGYQVENFGKSGTTLLSKGHRPYIEQDEFRRAIEFTPDIVVIHLGVNDTDPRDFPDYGDDFAADYIALIDSFKIVNPNVRIILANLSPLLSKHYRYRSGTRVWRDRLRELIPAVAEATGSELIDFGEVLRDHPEMLPDGIHPNVQGAGILAETVRGAITGHYGGLKLPTVYSDGMVLQRYQPINIKGRANAGENVCIDINGIRRSAVADNRGYWNITLPPMKETTGLTMTVAGQRDTIHFGNIAVGEVWLASGQSNMEFQLAATSTFEKNSDIYADSLLRLFDMKPIVATIPKEWSEPTKNNVDSLNYYLAASWRPSDEESAKQFSAVAWHFGRTLRDSLNVPVGIICNAIGGSPAEAWVDIETLEHGLPEILCNWQNNDYLQPWVQQRIRENVGSPDEAHRHPYEPSYLFAAGIRPLGAYPIAGVIWYQGESNAHNIEIHEELFPLLVDSWRKQWRHPNLPFLFVQLSSLNRPSWPTFRDSQRRLALQVPHTAMAVSSDLGDSLDVHPRNKQPIGQRLARQALNRVYSMTNIIPEGPRINRAYMPAKDIVMLSFDYADGLATSDGQVPRTFEVAQYDGVFLPVDSLEITENNEIKLYSMKIDNPCFVRYGWQPFTTANLVNEANLPASTFKIAIEQSPSLEEGINQGVSGAFVGSVNGIIIQAGGCNFPENPMAPDSKKQFYQGIYTLTSDTNNEWSFNKIGQLPVRTAYGAATSTSDGIVVIGGTDCSGKALDTAYVIKLKNDDEAEIVQLPSLPATIDNAYATNVGNKVYIAGGNVNGKPSNSLFSLDLNALEKGWIQLRPFPGNPRIQPVMASDNQHLYLWGGFAPRHDDVEPSLNTDGYKFDIRKNKWTPLNSPKDQNGNEVSTGGGAAVTLCDGRIAVAGGVNKDIFLDALINQAPDYLSHNIEWYRFNPIVFVFDPTNDSWNIAECTSQAARAGLGIATTDSNEILLIGGELKPRIRTTDIAKIKIAK